MASLPQYQGGETPFQLMQSTWATQINPVLSCPLVQGQLLTQISLVTGSNRIAHLLGRKLKGWYIVRKRADAAIYDTQDSESQPNLFLSLVTDTDVTVDVWVF